MLAHLRTRLVAAALGAFCGTASAHGLDPDRVDAVLHDDVIEMTATPPIDLVRFADVDGDGRLTVAEVSARRDEVRLALLAACSIADGEGRAGELERSDVSVPRDHVDGAGGSAWLRLSAKYRWARAPGAVRVRCAFAGERPVGVYATRAEYATPGVLTLVGDPETAVLSAAAPEVTLLRAPVQRASLRPREAPAAVKERGPSAAGCAAWAGLASLAGLSVVASRRRERPEGARGARGGNR